jgi:hypothetical protein
VPVRFRTVWGGDETLGQSLPTTATGGMQRGNLVRLPVVVRTLTARVPHPLHERSCHLDDFRASLAARKVYFVNRHLARVHPLHHECLGSFFGVSRTSRRHFDGIGHTPLLIGASARELKVAVVNVRSMRQDHPEVSQVWPRKARAFRTRLNQFAAMFRTPSDHKGSMRGVIDK